MHTKRWLAFGTSSPTTQTLVHFFPAARRISAPYPCLCKLSLFGLDGSGEMGRSVVLEGARLRQPDGVKVHEVFPEALRAEGFYGIVVELTTLQPRLDLSPSRCVIEFFSPLRSLRYRPTEWPRKREVTPAQPEDSTARAGTHPSDDAPQNGVAQAAARGRAAWRSRRPADRRSGETGLQPVELGPGQPRVADRGPLGTAFLFRDSAMRSSLLVVNASEDRIAGLYPEASGAGAVRGSVRPPLARQSNIGRANTGRASIGQVDIGQPVITPCSVSELAIEGETREMECPLGQVSVGVAHSAFPLPEDVSSYLLFREVGSGMPVSVCAL